MVEAKVSTPIFILNYSNLVPSFLNCGTYVQFTNFGDADFLVRGFDSFYTIILLYRDYSRIPKT